MQIMRTLKVFNADTYMFEKKNLIAISDITAQLKCIFFAGKLYFILFLKRGKLSLQKKKQFICNKFKIIQ